MSQLHGTALIPGAYHYGGAGLGLAGALVPSEGEAGPSYLYNDISLPADAAVEVRGLIEAWPVGLATFAPEEDGSFAASGPDGIYSFTYRLYADGVDLGTAVVNFTLGTTPGAMMAGGIVLANVVAAGLLQGGGVGLNADPGFLVGRGRKRTFRVWR